MDQKLIFLDVDGTLTPPGGYEPPESALAAIRMAREKGHKVFLCSGRNYAMLEPLLGYGFDGGIASCGGYVFAGDTVLHDCPMTQKLTDSLLRLSEENGMALEMEAKDASYCSGTADGLLRKYHEKNSDIRRMIKAVWADLGPRPMTEYDGRPVYKMVFVCAGRDQLDKVKTGLEDEFLFIVHDFSEADCIFGEIVNRRFDKGRAVRLIAETLGFDISDTVGFGDSMIDIEMIQAVGRSVCMDSGSPRLKEISDLICPSVDDDGIEWGFRKLALI